MADIKGQHFIAGRWIAGGKEEFHAYNPATGAQNEAAFINATKAEINEACEAAAEIFDDFARTSPQDRAAFLRAIADEIEKRADDITFTAHMETALPEARLQMERGRTVGQLGFFADWIEEGSWLQARIDQANPQREPMPKPDIRTANIAIGPVAVFGASNFPFAFSTAGGDTASALAAGCPVIVKAHPAHPATCEIIAQAIEAAIKSCNMPDGVFSQIQGADHETGAMLIRHPAIKAAGFTGSLNGGRALYDIAAAREEPIPFYGEMGSINPVFLLPSIMAEKAVDIAAGWAQSLTMGVGQFCTNPGLIVAIQGEAADKFKNAALAALKDIGAQPMLTSSIADHYAETAKGFAAQSGVETLLAPHHEVCSVSPALYRVSAEKWLSNHELSSEIFGPGGLIVTCKDEDEMRAVADKIEGQLTTTIHMNDDDTELAAKILPALERKSGRVLSGGFPTGVEVCHSMIHGGPYPATTHAGTTSVGTRAVERFVRPVSYQNMADALLPLALRDDNPLGIIRLVDGTWSDAPLSTINAQKAAG